MQFRTIKRFRVVFSGTDPPHREKREKSYSSQVNRYVRDDFSTVKG